MTHNAVRTDVGAEGPGNWVDQQGRQNGAALVYQDDLVLTPYFNSALTNTVVSINVGPTLIHMIEVSNIAATDGFLQLFNGIAAAVTLGTTAPTISFFVPRGDGTNRGAMDKVFNPPLDGFPNGLSAAFTTTATGSSALATAGVVNMAVR